MYCVRCKLTTPNCPYCTNCGGDVLPDKPTPGYCVCGHPEMPHHDPAAYHNADQRRAHYGCSNCRCTAYVTEGPMITSGDKPTVVTRAVSSEVVDVGIEFSKDGTVTATLNDNRFGGHMVWIPEWQP